VRTAPKGPLAGRARKNPVDWAVAANPSRPRTAEQQHRGAGSRADRARRVGAAPDPLPKPKTRIDKVKLRDLRRVCIHECGHMLVARHFGAIGHIRLELNDSGGAGERYVVGRFHLLMALVDPVGRRITGLAGAVAEHLHEQGVDAEVWMFGLLKYATCLSETDADFAGDYSREDVEACVALLRQLWPQVTQEAKLMYESWVSEVLAESVPPAGGGGFFALGDGA
jgi:hypothetical protein